MTELQRLAGRALLEMFGEASGFEMRLTRHCTLVLSGEKAADFNMLLLGSPYSDADRFLKEAVALADTRGLELLSLMAPAAAPALVRSAQNLGLAAAGTVPLMVLRGTQDVRPSGSCRIEEVRGREMSRLAGDLISSAFQLPREAFARALEPGMRSNLAASTFVAFAGDAPMSSATVTRTGDTAGVWSMATPPEHQGKGMGRALLSRIIERLSREGVERFYLFATAAGFPLYRSLGFVTLAEQPAWVKGSSTQTHA
ncbi:MAG: GNAT family N-acetyltransferase [Caulobacteraceae bacterium]